MCGGGAQARARERERARARRGYETEICVNVGCSRGRGLYSARAEVQARLSTENPSFLWPLPMKNYDTFIL